MNSLEEIIYGHKTKGERNELVKMEQEITLLMNIVRTRAMSQIRENTPLEMAKRNAAAANLRQAKENHQRIVEAILSLDAQ